MVAIVSDNQDVERCLEKILLEARRGGAEFADALILRCVQRSLSIELPPDATAESLIKLPENTLIPTGLFRLAIESDDIVIVDADSTVSAQRRALMESIVELYNLTGKIAWYRRSSLLLYLASHPELGQLIARGCDEPIRRALEKLAAGANIDRLVLRRFLGSRWFRFTDDSDAPTRVLMPILDLMNHHARGSSIENRTAEGGRFLHIERAKSMPREERECFVRYGNYDAMEMLLAYNFVDESATFVRSVPTEISLPNVGTIKVHAMKKKGVHKNLPPPLQDLSAYLPKIISKRPSYLEVTFLMIPTATRPHAFRRVMNVLIGTLNREYVDRLDLIVEAESRIIEANRAYYETLMTALRDAPAEGEGSIEVLRGLTRACELQLAHLESYSEMARSLAA